MSRPGAEPSPPLLQMREVNKTFGAFRALDRVHLSAWAGEVHGLMGENGAGKSTLMKILSGAYHADPGAQVLMDGAPVQLGSPQRARAQGIAVIYQELSLAPNLTVLENLFLGAEPARWRLLADRAAMRQRAAPVLEQLGMGFSPGQRLSSLSLGERQMVEIARAVMARARVVVMDEPTTSLSARESEKLFDIIARLKREGIAVLYISHRMEEVYRLCDRVSVLRDGGYVGSLTRSDLNAERLVAMMVGRDASSFYQKAQAAPAGAPVLAVRDLADGVRVHGCSLEARAGEVLGIAGLVGAGRTELARLICAAGRKTRGEVWLHGQPLNAKTPGQAIAAGVAYLSEDRKAAGLFLDMSVAENINIGVLAQSPLLPGVRHFARERARTARAMQELGVRAASSRIHVGALSGGNQQKVLLARLLQTHPRVLILDEPTRGVDVGAKSEIYRIIDALSRSGVAVIVISSDLPEILGIATRVLVMREGRVAGEVRLEDGNREHQAEAIMALATGAQQDSSMTTGGVLPCEMA